MLGNFTVYADFHVGCENLIEKLSSAGKRARFIDVSANSGIQ